MNIFLALGNRMGGNISRRGLSFIQAAEGHFTDTVMPHFTVAAGKRGFNGRIK